MELVFDKLGMSKFRSSFETGVEINGVKACDGGEKSHAVTQGRISE